MTTLVWLFLALGLAPLTVGAVRLRSAGRPTARWAPEAGDVLLCALAFNLTFAWQELWLVIPKALAGLHPVLFHNDHAWRGRSPVAELLQGTGALATLASGLGFAAALPWAPPRAPTWRRFVFWLAFQGLFQALVQLAIGTLLPGNDVGRALSYLHLEGPPRWALLIPDALALALAGAWLARSYPLAEAAPAARPARAFAGTLVATLVLATALVVPFRMPRDAVEVALVPLFVNLVGAGWLVLGLAIVPPATPGGGRPGVLVPALCLLALLLVFQLALRPGMAF